MGTNKAGSTCSATGVNVTLPTQGPLLASGPACAPGQTLIACDYIAGCAPDVTPVATIVGWNTQAEACACSCSPNANEVCAAQAVCTGPPVPLVAYVTDEGNSAVWQCAVLAANGSLADCVKTGSLPGGAPVAWDTPEGVAVVGSIAYVVDEYSGGGGVYQCAVLANNTLAGCTVTTAGFGLPEVIALGGGHVYVADEDKGIVACTVGVGGALSGCATTGSGITFEPEGVGIGGGFVYAAGEGLVSKCPINSDGSLGACTNTGDGAFDYPEAVTVYGGWAYVADDGSPGAVWLCAVRADGELTGCAKTGAGFGSPYAVAVAGARAYVSDRSKTPTVWSCDIGAGGQLSGCARAAFGGFKKPAQVAFSGSFPRAPLAG